MKSFALLSTSSLLFQVLSFLAPFHHCQAYQPLSPQISTNRRDGYHSFSISNIDQNIRNSKMTRVWFQNDDHQDTEATSASSLSIEEHRQEWIEKSVVYYSKVMREERQRNMRAASAAALDVVEEKDQDYQVLAKKHYFALQKIRTGKLQHAEHIYKRIINDLLEEAQDKDHACDHSKLAVTTLLLALLTQRMGASPKQTRSVFLKFFRLVSLDSDDEDAHIECACSAKVVGAFALFEMKQGNSLKSLQLAKKAFQLDPTGLKPLLHWKQFRDAKAAAERLSRNAKRRSSSRSSTGESAHAENSGGSS